MCIENLIEYNSLVIAPETILTDAIVLLYEQQEHNLPERALVATERKLVGIFSGQDIVRLVATGVDLATTTLEEVMTTPAIAITEQQCQDIQLVLSFFQQHSISYLPVVKSDRELVGVIVRQTFIQSLPDELKTGQTANSINHERQKKAAELERFFDFTPSMVCVAGFDGYFKQVNLAFQKNLGFTETEIITEPFINFVHSEDRAATIREFAELTAGKTTISFENRYRTKNGNYRWMLWTAKPNLAEQTIVCIAQDITEQKIALQNRQQAEERLAESENLLRTIIESEPECVKILDRDGKLLEMNPAGLAMIEADSLADAIDKSVYPLINPNHRQAFIDLTESIFEGKSGRLEFELTGFKGTSRWLETNAVPFKKGNEITALLAVTRDITQRKQAEIQLKQQNEFSNAIFNTVGALVAVLDRQGRIVSFNHTCEKVTGYSFAEVKDKKVGDFLVTPEEKTTVEAVFEKLLTGQFHNQYENYWVAKDGSKNLISWSNTALFDIQGEIEFIIATGIDVTEQRRVWNQLEFQYRQTRLLTEITDKIRMSIEIDQILQTTVTEVQQLLACDRVLIAKIRSNSTALPISEAILPDLPSMLGYELTDPLS